MKIKTNYGEYEITRIEISTYCSDNNLAIELFSLNEEWKIEEPFATLTVNLNYKGLEKNEAFVDVNNCPWAVEFIKENKLGEFTGIELPSGYCLYPLYKFDLNKLKEL